MIFLLIIIVPIFNPIPYFSSLCFRRLIRRHSPRVSEINPLLINYETFTAANQNRIVNS